MSRGSVKGTGYPLHSPVSPSLPLPCVTLCYHISTGVYNIPLETVDNLHDSIAVRIQAILQAIGGPTAYY